MSGDEPRTPFEKRPFPETWQDIWLGGRAWLEYQWGSDWEQHLCPYCGHRGWRVGEIVTMQNHAQWPVLPDSSHGSYPMLQVVCTTCQQHVLFSALSIFERRAEPPE